MRFQMYFVLITVTPYLRNVPNRNAQLIGGKPDRIPRMNMLCKFLTAPSGIKYILFSILNIFVNSLSAMICTEIHPFRYFN